MELRAIYHGTMHVVPHQANFRKPFLHTLTFRSGYYRKLYGKYPLNLLMLRVTRRNLRQNFIL